MDNKLTDLTIEISQDIPFLLKSTVAKSNGPGLYDGLMGVCISYFILSRITGEQKYRRTAFQYLNKVQQSIPEIDDQSFANGLAGIGWAVEWLVQNNFIKANTESVLEDLDDTLYTSVIYSRDATLSLAHGSIGKALYFLYRMQANNPHKRRYRVVCNLECLVLLSDEISEKIADKIDNLKDAVDFPDAEQIDIAQSLILLLRINDKKINTTTTLETIKTIIPFIEKYLIKHIKKHIRLDQRIGYFHMIYAYLLSLELLQKEGFTQDSILITDYLDSVNYTSPTVLNHLINSDTQLPSCAEDKYTTAPVPNFLALLRQINSIENTSYGYEGFLL